VLAAHPGGRHGEVGLADDDRHDGTGRLRDAGQHCQLPGAQADVVGERRVLREQAQRG
jgi:hypothetical protein